MGSGTSNTGGYASNAAANAPAGYGIGSGNAAGSAAASQAQVGYIPTNYQSYAAPANYYLTPLARAPVTTGTTYDAYTRNALNMAPKGYGIGTGTAAGSKSASANSMLSGFPNSSSIQGQSMYAAPSMRNKITSGIGDLFKNKELQNQLKSQIPGLLSLGLGKLMPNPEYKGPTSADARKLLEGKSATAEGAAARAKMLEYINNPENIGGTATVDYVKALNADHDASDAATLAKFDSDWIAQGYNTTGSDYFKAKADLQAKLNNARNTEVGAARAALYQTQLTAQLQMISQQYGIEMNLLTDLMELDVQTAARKYDMSVKEIDDFRKAVQAMLGVATTQQAQ